MTTPRHPDLPEGFRFITIQPPRGGPEPSGALVISSRGWDAACLGEDWKPKEGCVIQFTGGGRWISLTKFSNQA